MPRTARASVANYCYHVLNRGNGRAEVFHKAADYEGFLEMMAAGQARLAMRVIGYCLMPNHFHLVLRPRGDGDLGRWMQWLLTTHVRRYGRQYGFSGHVWQGRFRSFPCQSDAHLITVLRYVEGNALRGGLVKRPEAWPFSSLHARRAGAGPVKLAPMAELGGAAWVRRVNQPMREAELAALRNCVARGAPYGSEAWTRTTVRRLGLEASIRPLGRPRKDA